MELKTPAEMDAAADIAEAELKDIIDYPDEASAYIVVRRIAEWWKRWYLEAGHKRLGRILLRYSS